MKDAGRYIKVKTVMTLTVALSSTPSCVKRRMRVLISLEFVWFPMSSKLVSNPRVACTRCARISAAFKWPCIWCSNSCNSWCTTRESPTNEGILVESPMLMSIRACTRILVLRRHLIALHTILSSIRRSVCKRSGLMMGLASGPLMSTTLMYRRCLMWALLNTYVQIEPYDQLQFTS